MSCAEILRTQAWLDGELEGPPAQAAARHTESCAECQAFISSVADLSDALRKRVDPPRAPAGLRERVVRQIDVSGAVTPLVPRRRFWQGAAAGSAITALAAGVFALFVALPQPAGRLAQAVTDAHTQAMMSDRNIEVVSSSHHTVKPWFAGRVAVSPPVTDFAQQGFTLLGGRVDEIDGVRAAVVVYRHGAHQVDLYVWEATGRRPGGEAVRHGYVSVFWRRGDLDFAAVSDVNEDELRRFVALVRSAPE
ncbi:MAG: anti-sigma factor [Proteobacteria bacterium]|nr:anti-sigma factor [Pseudomonadota bacterium]